MSFPSNLASKREEPETARVGMIWTDQENTELMEQAMYGKGLDEIANKHQRTIRGVKARIMSNALNIMTDKNISLEDVASLVHISVQDLVNFKQKQEKKRLGRKMNEAQPEFMMILTEIRDYLKIIAEK